MKGTTQHILLVRHGLTRLTGPVLAGWTPGLHLDERGVGQASLLATRLRDVPLSAVVSSPLERCLETVRPVLDEVGVETGMFDIPAGGRRYRALELLVKQKRLARNAPIRVFVRPAAPGG